MSDFSLKDWTVQVGPAVLADDAGLVPAGPGVPLISFTKLALDPGGDAEYIMGASVHPLAIAIKSAKGKLEIDLSRASEGWKVRKAVGGVGGSCYVLMIAARFGMIPEAYALFGTLKNGGGFEVDDSKGTGGKLEIMFTKALSGGVSIYNELA